MAKYDWEKLKQEFITSSVKQTLKQFAIDKKLPYGLLRQNSSGWVKLKRTKNEQKANKIIDKTIEKQIDSDVEMNIRHYNIGVKLLDAIEKSAQTEGLYVFPKSINSLAKSLETIQKVQRIASGLEDGTPKGDVVKDFMEAVTNGNNEDTSK